MSGEQAQWWKRVRCDVPALGLAVGLTLASAACGGAPVRSDGDVRTVSGPVMETRIGVGVAWDGSGIPPGAEWAEEVAEVTVAARLERMPSGVAVWEDRMFIAIPRWDGGDSTLHEWRDGALAPWPSAAANDATAGSDRLHSVNGLRVDDRGRLWVLDNGRVNLGPPGEGVPKVVVYDVRSGAELFRHVFPPEVAPSTSFMNDLALDLDRGFVYFTETGMGGPAALVVLEIAADRSRRVLEGHGALSPDPGLEMVIDGQVATILRDGERHPWRVGANPVALAADGESLLFGAMTHRQLFRVETRLLRDPSVPPEELEAAVHVAFDKPMSDGMDVLADGRPVLTDVEHASLVVVDADGQPHVLVRSPAWFVFPVAIHVVDERTLYFTSNQLQDMPLLHGGEDRTTPPYWVWRVGLRSNGP